MTFMSLSSFCLSHQTFWTPCWQESWKCCYWTSFLNVSYFLKCNRFRSYPQFGHLPRAHLGLTFPSPSSRLHRYQRTFSTQLICASHIGKGYYHTTAQSEHLKQSHQPTQVALSYASILGTAVGIEISYYITTNDVNKINEWITYCASWWILR